MKKNLNIRKYSKDIKIITMFFLILLCSFVLVGCTTKEEKEKILKQYLYENYEDYEIIESCTYDNEAGTDVLSSIIKLDNNYKIFDVDFDSKGQIYVSINEKKLLSFIMYDNIIIGETNASYDNTQLTLIVDKSMKDWNKYVKNLCLNYSQDKKNIEGFYLEVYFVDSFVKNSDVYKQFMISQVADYTDRCFFSKYENDLGILNKFESNHLWLPTSNHKDYINNYKDFINEQINKLVKYE